MQFTPLITQITTATTAEQLRDRVMSDVGNIVGATAWGLDLYDRQGTELASSDLAGLSETFRDRYRELPPIADRISHYVAEHHTPAHNRSQQSATAWQQSEIYQQLFRSFDLEHAAIAPLVGQGRMIGAIYFLRDRTYPAFTDRDLIQLSPLYQHLSAQFTALRLTDNALFDRLTQREQTIVTRVAQGMSNRTIAQQLYISPDAVKQSLQRIFRKLEVNNRAAMVAKLGQSSESSWASHSSHS
jgi:DNA-binding CsgD family transcriptional regulator